MSDIRDNVQHIASQLQSPEDDFCRNCERQMPADEDGACEECGEELTPMSGFDYLSDVLDIEYIVNGARQYLGARVLVCFGGPNIWVNTKTGMVDGYWWNESHSESFVDNVGLDDALRELWECGA